MEREHRLTELGVVEVQLMDEWVFMRRESIVLFNRVIISECNNGDPVTNLVMAMINEGWVEILILKDKKDVHVRRKFYIFNDDICLQ